MECHAEKLQVVGLPVADRFCRAAGELNGNPQEIRMATGSTGHSCWLAVARAWVRLEKTAHAINDAGLKAALVIVTGRNRRLKSRLEKYPWTMPVSIYGFVRSMPDFMRAANVLVTKAGPGTISEACIAGLPIILYSKVPGQEDGNVDYVVNEGAGVWAPEPEQVVAALQTWLNAPELTLAGCIRTAEGSPAQCRA